MSTRCAIWTAALLLMTSAAADAATQYYLDTDGDTTTGTGVIGGGTYDWVNGGTTGWRKESKTGAIIGWSDASTSQVTLTGSAGTLVIADSETRIASDINPGAAGFTISGGTLNLSGTTDAKRSLILNSVITGNGGFSKTSSGTFTISGANTYTGGTTITGVASGDIAIGSSSVVDGTTITSGPLGTGALTISSGAMLRSNSATARSLANVVNFNSSTVNLGGTATGTTGALTFTGAGTLAQNTTFNINSSVTYSGALSGSNFALTKTGSATMVLSGENTYSGDTNVLCGGLSLGSTGALGNSTNVTLTGGTAGNNSYGTYVNISSGANGASFSQTLQMTTSGTTNYGRTSLINNAETAEWSGAISISGDTNAAMIYANSGTTLTISGDITGSFANSSFLSIRGSSTGNGYITGDVDLGTATLSKTDAGAWTIGAIGSTAAWGDTAVKNGTLTLVGATKNTGDVIFYDASCTLVLDGGSMLVNVKSHDDFTEFTGTGTLTANGTFAFDLTSLAQTGDWQIVSTAATLARSYESGFGVTFTRNGFTYNGLEDLATPGVWKSNLGDMNVQFSEGTGLLTVSAVPEPGTLTLLGAGLIGLIAYAWRRRK